MNSSIDIWCFFTTTKKKKKNTSKSLFLTTFRVYMKNKVSAHGLVLLVQLSSPFVLSVSLCRYLTNKSSHLRPAGQEGFPPLISALSMTSRHLSWLGQSSAVLFRAELSALQQKSSHPWLQVQGQFESSTLNNSLRWSRAGHLGLYHCYQTAGETGT